MPQTSSKWELHVGRSVHIISGEEMQAILNAGESRFVRFRDLVINPAFVTQMRLISTDSLKITGPDESALNSEEWLEKHI